MALNPRPDPFRWRTEPQEASPIAVHRRLPGYQVTPLHSLDALARDLGLGAIYIKDESDRLTLPAFKVLGASWAVYRLVTQLRGGAPEPWEDVDHLRYNVQQDLGALRLVTATDGNHGRGVARVARWLGWEARVFMPEETKPVRIEAIREDGARVTVVEGDYDDAVRLASHQQSHGSTFLVQDTSWPGYEEIPAWIIEGYRTLMDEVEQQLARLEQEVDLVLVPVGVGSLAAAVLRHFRREGLERAPRVVGVEALGTSCALASLAQDERVSVSEASTIMAGLNCPSLATLAWPPIQQGMDAVIGLEDGWAVEAMRRLAQLGIVSGESGAASTAGLLALMLDDALAPLLRELAVTSSTRVLLLNTEGATDPDAWRAIVGA